MAIVSKLSTYHILVFTLSCQILVGHLLFIAMYGRLQESIPSGYPGVELLEVAWLPWFVLFAFPLIT